MGRIEGETLTCKLLHKVFPFARQSFRKRDIIAVPNPVFSHVGEAGHFNFFFSLGQTF